MSDDNKNFWHALQSLPIEYIFFVCLVFVLAGPISSIDNVAVQTGIIVFIILIGCVILFRNQGIYVIKDIRLLKEKEKAREEELVGLFNAASHRDLLE